MGKIFIIVILLLLLAAAVYIFRFGGMDQITTLLHLSQTATSTPAASSSQPPADTRTGFFAVTAQPVVSPILSLTQRTVWYFDQSGQLYRSQFDGSGEQSFALTDFRPASFVLWPLTGSDFIERTTDAAGANQEWRLYQATAQKWLDLPANIKYLSWLPDGQRIAYVWQTGSGAYQVKLANSDTSNFSTLASASSVFTLRPAPSGNFLLEIPSLSDAASHKIYRYDLSRQTQSELVSDGINIDASISPDGTKVLFTRENTATKLPELWLVDLASGTPRNLSVTTSISKTVWAKASDKFYYALPATVAPGDYTISGKTQDALFAYVLASGTSAGLPEKFDSLKIDARDILALDSDNMLFFRNGWDGKLYRLNTK